MLAELVELIDRYGWAVRHVGAGDQPGEAAFSYTVGLTAFDHPEMVVVGMPFEHSQGFLNLIGSLVRDGRTFLHGTTTRDLTDGAYWPLSPSPTTPGSPQSSRSTGASRHSR